MQSENQVSSQRVLKALKATADPEKAKDTEKAKFFPCFFKTGPGGYGEGDFFLGVTVPKQRLIAKRFRDLVDSSAGKILGTYWCEIPAYAKRIDKLAASGQLWRERVAVIATQSQIKQGDFRQLLKLAKRFLNHEHDLMHKAVGWMLREMGQVDLKPLIAFLDEYAGQMPRTMLRSSIEKLAAPQRQFYLKK